MPGAILAVAERSGLIEEYHPGAFAVASPDGSTPHAWGDVARPFYIRSAAKPFQAHAALMAGADLPDVHLALACASHPAEPVHLAIVDDMLARFDLTEEDLGCPPARPRSPGDRELAAATGDVAPARRFHNCSGKHAAMLAACRMAGWDTGSYLDPAHPLQKRIAEVIADVTGQGLGPAGVDGCGAPVWPITTRGLALAYARLATDPSLARVRTAMARYPALVGGHHGVDTAIARWLGAPVKGGAAGCMGASVAGFGVAAKAWSGSGVVAGMGVMAGLARVGVVTSAISAALEAVAEPPVWGGGRPVGRFRLSEVLEPQ